MKCHGGRTQGTSNKRALDVQYCRICNRDLKRTSMKQKQTTNQNKKNKPKQKALPHHKKTEHFFSHGVPKNSLIFF